MRWARGFAYPYRCSHSKASGITQNPYQGETPFFSIACKRHGIFHPCPARVKDTVMGGLHPLP
ncbi:hypothetical protein ANK1_0962 [plant metagenome]|uniref:Uncharacterized protein n=1 Tax=plant metagenome TaxID=1297885 RepID=A0A484NXW3_9ZZZZ